MRIEINKYIIENDELQFVLKEKIINKRKDSKNKERIAVIGYFGRLDHLFEKILVNELLKSEANTLIELKEDIKTISKNINEMKDFTISKLKL